MADNSTHADQYVASRHHRVNIRLVKARGTSGRDDMPSAATIAFIRQFARVYHVNRLLPDGLCGLTLN